MKQQWEPPELEEMPIVILSLHQKWWQKMAAGEKVLELRKTKPQCKAPFRVLVYVTGGVGIHDIHNYAAGSRNKVYGWEVSTVKEYEKPMALEALGIKRAPQSWQYVR